MAETEEVEQPLKDLVNLPPSVIRTFVPIVINGLTMLGLDQVIENDALWTVSSVLVAITYYITVRILETYVNPKFGALIFSVSAPTYNKSTPKKELESSLTPAADPVESSSAPETPSLPGQEEEPVPSEPKPDLVHNFEGEIPEGFGFLLQQDKSDDEANAAIAAEDAAWMQEEARRGETPAELVVERTPLFRINQPGK